MSFEAFVSDPTCDLFDGFVVRLLEVPGQCTLIGKGRQLLGNNVRVLNAGARSAHTLQRCFRRHLGDGAVGEYSG